MFALQKSLMRKSIIGVGAATLLLTLVAGCGAPQNKTTESATPPKNTANSATSGQKQLKTSDQQWSSPPKMTIDQNKQYDAVVTTNYGDFTIQLLPKESPVTVNNFVFLAEHGFYKNNTFFRIIKNFMIQTGDPSNTGSGGPGYQFKDELPPKQPYKEGTVAMANSGPNTNGSQFFICTVPDQKNLQPNYTIFGNVVKGMNVIKEIANIPVTTNPNSGEDSYPTLTAYIESVKIEVH
ncbi:peptidylprolyl isomerase [Alicyclobacillus fodiniaquatilis]|uniref:Peptidyl-prolyl cis-trans isomerase n=1 Tax=Alicyclobacillus fodiniaquatilis TaxID=1661150 RepID=A0ABW4JCL0_9BACL